MDSSCQLVVMPFSLPWLWYASYQSVFSSTTMSNLYLIFSPFVLVMGLLEIVDWTLNVLWLLPASTGHLGCQLIYVGCKWLLWLVCRPYSLSNLFSYSRPQRVLLWFSDSDSVYHAYFFLFPCFAQGCACPFLLSSMLGFATRFYGYCSGSSSHGHRLVVGLWLPP